MRLSTPGRFDESPIDSGFDTDPTIPRLLVGAGNSSATWAQYPLVSASTSPRPVVDEVLKEKLSG